MKKLLSIVMALALVLTALAVGAVAEEGGKHLNIGYYQISTLDPVAGSWEITRIGVGERMFKLNDDLELEPWLVESYEKLDDTTWTFTLRDGVKFSNGKDMTGDAVKACLDRTVANSSRATSMLNIASIEADGQVLTITTNAVNAALPNNLADLVGTILDVDTLDDENQVPVGTGPFAIVSASDDLYELEANPYYWNGAPKLSSITIKVIGDGNALAMALDNGEVDLAFQLPVENVPQFVGNDSFVITEDTGSRGQTMYFDFTNPVLADVNVRKAIMQGIDREVLASVVNKGNTTAACGIFPVSFAYGDVEGVAFDAEAAKASLAEAGYTDTDGDGIVDKDGEKLSLMFYTYGTRGAVLPTLAEAIQAMLKDIGIEITIELNDYNPHIEILKAGGFDLALNSNIQAPVADPQYFIDLLVKTGADFNYGQYSSEEADALVAELSASFDWEQRVEVAKAIQDKVNEDAAFFVLGHQVYRVLAKNTVTGFATQGTELYLLNENVDIAE